MTPWKSMAMSTSLPTASRIAAKRAAVASTNAGVSTIRTGDFATPVFSAV